MKIRGNKLEFISWICRDGSGTVEVPEGMLKVTQEEILELTCLSLSEKTYIASGFNSFVVKLKQQPKADSKELTPIQQLVQEINKYKEHKCFTSTDECVIGNVLGIIQEGKYLEKERKVIEDAYLSSIEKNGGLGDGMGAVVDIQEAEEYYYNKFKTEKNEKRSF